jgi:twinkle protein
MARLHGWKFALCSFENQPEEHIAKLAEKWAHAPFWDGPTPRMDEATLSAAVNWINEHFTFIRAEDESPTIEWILDKAKAAVLRMGVKGLVIDPWNEIEHNRPDRMSETEYVSQVLGKVRRFAKVSGCHVWFVAHPMKLQRDKEGKRPAPGPYDISGSAHWANKADFAITVHRPGDHGTITEIHIAKVRHKWLGKKGTVKLRYIVATGEYSGDLEGLG